MKGMIFAAGIGSRLRPFTDSHPKALAPVGGVPMLRRVIEKMTAAGIRDIVVNTHHFPDQIRAYLDANDCFGASVRISDESGLLLDTGGGILRARRWLEGSEPVAVHNADILTDFPLAEMAAAREAAGATATLLAFKRPSTRQLYFDSEGALAGWGNLVSGDTKPEGFTPAGHRELAFGGVHVISPGIFPLLEEYARGAGEVFSIVPFYLAVCRSARVTAYTPGAPFMWHDIGTPAKLAAAEAAVDNLRVEK